MMNTLTDIADILDEIRLNQKRILNGLGTLKLGQSEISDLLRNTKTEAALKQAIKNFDERQNLK